MFLEVKFCEFLFFFPEHLEPDDIPDYEFTFAITRGGSRVITGIWDGIEQKVDCYAFSALKIAHCSRAQGLKKGLLSGLELGEPHLTEENGYGPYFGAICVEVYKTLGDGSLEPWCGIYVCVSGADSKDDPKCAFAAIPVINGFFSPKAGFQTIYPVLPEDVL